LTPKQVEQLRQRSYEVEGRLKAALGERREFFADLYRLLADLFRAQAAGQKFQRRPTLGLNLPAPGDPPLWLSIRPRWDRWHKAVDTGIVEMEVIAERDLADRPAREVTIQLSADKAHISSWAINTAEAQLPRALAVLDNFLADPDQVFAKSAESCCVCHKTLTDPVSRSRGVGPECLRVRDWLRWATKGRQGDPPCVAREAPRPKPGKVLFKSDDGAVLEREGTATVVGHYDHGDSRQTVRWFRTCEPKTRLVYNPSGPPVPVPGDIEVLFKFPQLRREDSIKARADSSNWVEVLGLDGEVLWDSRRAMAFDPAKFEEAKAKVGERRKQGLSWGRVHVLGGGEEGENP
jgi:hypothetical protein